MRIRHKALRRWYETGSEAGLPAALLGRLARRLDMLALATGPKDMAIPGWRLHALKGERSGQWAVRVSGNWRLIFRFEAGEAVDVDLVDYH